MFHSKKKIIKRLREIVNEDELRQYIVEMLFPKGTNQLPDPDKVTLLVGCTWEIGKSDYKEKQYKSSVKFLGLARDLAAMLMDKSYEISILCDLGFAYYFLDQFDATIDQWRQAWALCPKLDDPTMKQEIQGEIAYHLANVYRQLRRFRDAIPFDQFALDFHRKKLKAESNSRQKIQLKQQIGYDLNFLGLSYSHVGPVEEAISNYNLSLKIAEELGDGGEKINRLGNLARVYAISGQREQALELFLNAGDKLSVKNADAIRTKMLIDMSVGNVYRELGQPARAKMHYESALQNARKLKDGENENRLLNSLGIIYRDLGELDKALQYYEEGLEVARRTGDEIGESDALGNIGNYYYQTGQPDLAEPYYLDSLKISTKLHDTVFMSRWTGNLANVYHSLGDLKKAIQYYQNALELSQNIHDKDQEYLWNYNLGSICRRKLKKFDKAYDYYLAAIICLQELRREVKRDDFSRSFGESKVFVYQDMVDLCLRLSDRKLEAIGFAEQGKGYTLTRMMAEASLEPSQDVPSEYIEKYKSLLARQRLLEKELTEILPVEEKNRQKSEERSQSVYERITEGSQDHRNILRELIEVRRSQDENFEKISEYDPIFCDVFNPKKISITEIQEHLTKYDKQTALIEFFVTGEQTNVFIVTKDDWHSVQITQFNELDLSRMVLEEWIEPYQAYRTSLQQVRANEEANRGLGALPDRQQVAQESLRWQDAIMQIGRNLYSKLWEPIQFVLDTLQLKRLILIPHAGLHLLPLHLIHSDSSSEDKSVNYLFQKYEISYAPSFRLLSFCHEKERTKRQHRNFFAVSDPDGSLPWADLEVRLISDWFKDLEVLRHQEATRQSIKNHVEPYNFIHFATHGRGATFDSMQADLMIADGNLNLREIFTDIRLPQAYAVILSACETGMIQLDRGDEYIGLPSAFLCAGAPTVVSSLWMVDDVSTGLLMSRWYENIIKSGMKRAEALREAQQWLSTLPIHALVYFLEDVIARFEYDTRNPEFSFPQNGKTRFSNASGNEHRGLGTLPNRQLRNCIEKLEEFKKCDPNECPFNHPEFWGGFFITGNAL